MNFTVPSLLLTVDPGSRGCGVALFHRGVLVRAEYLAYLHTKEKVWPHGDTAADRVACAAMVWAWFERWLPRAEIREPGDLTLLIEEMQVYAGSLSKGDPEDLLRLQAVGYAVAGRVDIGVWRVESVKAGEWNGQVPREIRMNRTRGWCVDAGTVDRVVTPEREPRLVHNAWSAVSIGRWRIDPAARR